MLTYYTYLITLICFVKNVTTALYIVLPERRALTLFFFLLVGSLAKAQTCVIPIFNNSIQIRPAVCAGSVATLQGSTPVGGNGSYTYQWQKSVGNCGNGNFTDIPGATFRDYAVPASTNNKDCFRRIVRSGSCNNTSDPLQFENDERTTPVAPITTVVNSACQSATGSITVTDPSPAAGIFFSIDGTNYTNTSGVFTGLAAGTYPVTARFPAGCVSPIRTQVVGTTSGLSGSITPASAAFCAGDSQVLSVSGGTSYRWYRNDAIIPGATANTYTAKDAGIYTVDLIAGTCTTKASNSVNVTVNPVPSGAIAPSTVTICGGNSATLNATGGISYQWYRNGNLLTGQTNATLSVNQAGTYTVDVINSFGCKAKASNSSVVTVVPGPSGTITPSTATLCGTGSVPLSVTGGSSYQWYLNGIAINSATSATYSATTGGTYTVDIISGPCTTKASNSAVITQLAQSATISPANVTLCPGNTQPLTVSGSGGTYQWYRDNVIIPGATGNTYIANLPGTYSVTIVNGTCSTQASNMAVVSVGVNPSGVISPANVSLCPGRNVTLTAIGAGGGYSFQWFRNGQFIQNATNSTYTTSEPGSYSVLFTNGGCTAASQNIVTVSISAPITFNTSTTEPGCTSPVGSITVNGVTGGGNAVYRYSKDNGANFQTSNIFPNLTAGTYQILVRDTAGCVSAPRSVTIQQNGVAPTLNVTDPPRICPDQTVNLQAAAITAGSDNGLVFTYWRDTTATTQLVNPGATAPGRYFIKATNGFGCIAIKAVNGRAHAVTAGSISPAMPPVSCIGTPVELKATSGTAYQWYHNDTLITGATAQTHKAAHPGDYSVIIDNGTCAVKAANKVKITFQPCVPDAKVFVPTAFTPNKNGENDVLRPILYNITELRYFKVYNRWGQEVFQTKEMGKGWDGTLKGSAQPSETYSWILECIGKNGEIIKESGRSLLIR